MEEVNISIKESKGRYISNKIQFIETDGYRYVATRDIIRGELLIIANNLVVYKIKEDLFTINSWEDKDWDNEYDKLALYMLSSGMLNEEHQSYNADISKVLRTIEPIIQSPLTSSDIANKFKRNLFMFRDNIIITDVGNYTSHSCIPNCSCSVDLTNDCVVFTSMRDIKKDEIITYSKCPFPIDDRDLRREWLRSYYGFDCNCKGCSPNPESYPSLVLRQQYINNYCWHCGTSESELVLCPIDEETCPAKYCSEECKDKNIALCHKTYHEQ